MARWNRPAGAYDSTTTAINSKKYQSDSSAIPKVPISSAKVDGDLNKLMDAVNLLDQDIQSIVVGGIPDGSITTAKLAPDAVTSDKIVDGTITSADIGAGEIKKANMSTNVVDTDQLIDEAITTAKIGNFQITESKIANGSITKDKLAPNLQLNLPKGYINDEVKYISSNQISWKGECRDAADTTDLVVTSAVTGVLGGSPADATRHMYIGFNADPTPIIIAEFCTNLDGSDLTAITGAKRRVVSVVTDGSGDLIEANYYASNSGALTTMYATRITELNPSFNVGVYSVDFTVPDGFTVGIILSTLVRNTGSGSIPYLSEIGRTNQYLLGVVNSTSQYNVMSIYNIKTSTAQLSFENTSNALNGLGLYTLGYIDERTV